MIAAASKPQNPLNQNLEQINENVESENPHSRQEQKQGNDPIRITRNNSN